MNDNPQNQFIPPYGDVASKLLDSIFESLSFLCCIDSENKQILEEEINKRLYRNFEWIKTVYPVGTCNRHLNYGYSPHGDPPTFSTRIGKLIRLAWKTSCDEAIVAGDTKKDDVKVFVPSPMRILYDILTVPEHPQSRAYALLTCRNMLFERFRVHPKTSRLKELTAQDASTQELSSAQARIPFDIFSEKDINDLYSEIEVYTGHRDNYPKPKKIISKTERTKLFLAHFLAMNGVLQIKFGTKDKKRLMPHESFKMRADYCKGKDIIGDSCIHYEFRRSKNFSGLTNVSEVVNQIFGIPLPLPNADVVFNGAMKFSSDGSLVISAHGKSGTGKTSFALAVAAALAPLGTETYYITFEENPDDLYVRLNSLIPPYMRKLSFFEEDFLDWCRIPKVDLLAMRENAGGAMSSFTDKYLKEIKKILDESRQTGNTGSVPICCPLLIVVDGISMLCKNQDAKQGYQSLHDFINACRSLNVLVILLSGEDSSVVDTMDYLVDTIIKLKYEYTDTLTNKPLRIFQLLKTRQQHSRAGSHVFHIASEKGFRFAPQLPSQLDQREKIARHLPDQKQVIDIFDGIQGKDTKSRRYLDIFPGAQILLHGHGSSGKAGLALKILMTQPKDVHVHAKVNNVVFPPSKRKILIVSFLYTGDYYSTLKNRLSRKVDVEESTFTTLAFYPGYLMPENFLSKIIRRLKTAELEGEPYTGVLLDGLHNVFLQFPSLKDNTMVWPMLYNILVRAKVTTATTFTTFSFAFTQGLQDKADGRYDEMLIEGHKPFLHALVQAVDYYLMLERNEKPDEKGYKLSIKEALGPEHSKGKMIWDREKLVFTKWEP